MKWIDQWKTNHIKPKTCYIVLQLVLKVHKHKTCKSCIKNWQAEHLALYMSQRPITFTCLKWMSLAYKQEHVNAKLKTSVAHLNPMEESTQNLYHIKMRYTLFIYILHRLVCTQGVLKPTHSTRASLQKYFYNISETSWKYRKNQNLNANT